MMNFPQEIIFMILKQIKYDKFFQLRNHIQKILEFPKVSRSEEFNISFETRNICWIYSPNTGKPYTHISITIKNTSSLMCHYFWTVKPKRELICSYCLNCHCVVKHYGLKKGLKRFCVVHNCLS